MATAGKRSPTPVRDRVIDSALALAAERGWTGVSMAEIAEHAGVSVGDAFEAFPSTAAIMDGFFARAERQVLTDAAPDFGETARDRVFDVVMARFDALAPHKPAVAAFLRDLPADPLTVLMIAPRFAARLARSLEAAGLSSTGPLGAVRINGLAVIYLTTLRVWLEDDSPDMARTMATLDRGLRRAESMMRTASDLMPASLCRRGPRAAEAREPGGPSEAEPA